MTKLTYPWITNVGPGNGPAWVEARAAERALDEAREVTQTLNDQLRNTRTLLDITETLLDNLVTLLKMTDRQDEMPATLQEEGNLHDQIFELQKRLKDGY